MRGGVRGGYEGEDEGDDEDGIEVNPKHLIENLK